MKLTTQLQEEIEALMNDYWSSYLKGDLQQWQTFLPDDYKNIGTTTEEIWNSKQQIVDYTKTVIDQMVGMVELRNKKTEIIPYAPYFMVHEFADIFIVVKNEWSFYAKMRLSSLIEKTRSGWKVLHQHGSYPDSKAQEGEAFAFDKIAKENQELKEGIKRRTIELELKNRDLEIETSLEKVRAVALSMHEPSDMVNVCKTISDQLVQLGFNEIRNIQTVIIYEEKHEYLNYQYFTAYDQNSIERIDYNLHPDVKEFSEIMLESKDAFYEKTFEGEELKTWVEYRKQTNQVADPKLEETNSAHYYFYSIGKGALGVTTYAALNQEQILLFKRFRNVFDLAYRRFLDIEKALAQAREAQIETALERVRAKAMAMHQSADLNDAVCVVFEQLSQLNFGVLRCGIGIMNREMRTADVWVTTVTDEGSAVQVSGDELFDIHPLLKNAFETWASGGEEYSYILEGDDMIRYYESLGGTNFHLPASELKLSVLPDSYRQYYYVTMFEAGGLFIFDDKPFEKESQLLLKRFASVFNMTYKRYQDIEKAEGQAREAKVEMSLERVRSRTMAMQHSDELPAAANVLFQEVQSLGIPAWSCGYNVLAEDKKTSDCWMSSEGAIQEPFTLYFTEESSFIEWYKFLESDESFYVQELGGKELEDHYNYMRKIPKLGLVIDKLEDAGIRLPTYQINHLCKYSFGFLLFITYEQVPDAHPLFKRFTKVFEQTYTRFLDLQKSEAQSRETQIELGLERVRARAMAMQTSGELSELVDTVFKELTKLDFALSWCMINIIDELTMSNTVWGANPEIGKPPEQYHMLFEDYRFHHEMFKAWKEKKVKWRFVLKGNEKEIYDEYLFNQTEFRRVPQEVQKQMRASGKYEASFTFSNFGGIQTVGEEPLSEANLDILARFGKVFDLTYTRFHDLQKAEAQAKESRIEAALERTRSRTMAMQNSSELADVATLLFRELNKLVDNLWTCGFVLCEKGRGEDEWWLSDENGFIPAFYLPNTGDITHANIYQAWSNGETYHTEQLAGDALQQHYDWLMSLPQSKQVFNEMAAAGFKLPEWQKLHCAFFKTGYLVMITQVPCYEEEIFKRFAQAFDITYTRFLDLQKAEAQAREAQIETALERIRSRTMAMQKSSELSETAAVVFQQLIGLGIDPNRLYIGIVNAGNKDMEMWATDEEGRGVGNKFIFNADDNETVKKLYDGWVSGVKSICVDMKGEELENYFNYLRELKIPLSHGLTQKRRVQIVAYFDKGFIGMASPDQLSIQSIHLLERFAAVFNLTFTRFNDLQIAEAHALQAEQDLIIIKEEKQKAEAALTELKSTQRQLIQSEKMASLGELTAGIAHEIQNPLNFVNNFSEVSRELIDEMNTELDQGNISQARQISVDVIQNLEKILHHGKRADGIVKGMLQHSRESSGRKEPTDINALADEYLRLAYHGLRAKDKSFNATLITDYDKTIGNINIIPQDISRVVLNLISNAFYACNERSHTKVNKKNQQQQDIYQPTVSLITKKNGNKVELTVADNGSGIEQKVVDKIFQPFFTTKPTGEGTGLGLSLAFDIVKAHGGEMKVETVEGEGSIFTMALPV